MQITFLVSSCCETVRYFPAIVCFSFVLSAMLSHAAVSISVQCPEHSWSAFLTPLSHRYIGPSTVFGSSGKLANVEQWRCVSILRSHSGGEWGCLLGWAALGAVRNAAAPPRPLWTELVLKAALCLGHPPRHHRSHPVCPPRSVQSLSPLPASSCIQGPHSCPHGVYVYIFNVELPTFCCLSW